uniref:Uncharacterized protein n=1 Tax=Oryza rufipogon TaxID=4529 RepID=A0A0E0R4D1_ORYRU
MEQRTGEGARREALWAARRWTACAEKRRRGWREAKVPFAGERLAAAGREESPGQATAGAMCGTVQNGLLFDERGTPGFFLEERLKCETGFMGRIQEAFLGSSWWGTGDAASEGVMIGGKLSSSVTRGRKQGKQYGKPRLEKTVHHNWSKVENLQVCI